MIPITQTESNMIRKLSPSTFIVVSNKQHKSKHKSYSMTCERKALELLLDTNIYARREMCEILQNDYLDAMQNRYFKKAEDIKGKINKIKELGL